MKNYRGNGTSRKKPLETLKGEERRKGTGSPSSRLEEASRRNSGNTQWIGRGRKAHEPHPLWKEIYFMTRTRKREAAVMAEERLRRKGGDKKTKSPQKKFLKKGRALHRGVLG